MEKKIFWKFNIIDLLLIGILAVSVIALLYKITWGKQADETESFLFTYVCQSAPSETFQGIAPGLSCTDGDYGNSLGELTSVQNQELENDSQNQRCIFISQVEGKKNTHGVMVNEVLYLKGKSFNLVIGDSIFPVYLSEIQTLQQ